MRVQVVDASGHPVARAKVVKSVMWPTIETSKAHGGMSPSAVTRTDDAGVATLSVGSSQADRDAAEANGGWLNLSITTIDASGVPHSESVTRYLGSKTDQIAQAPKADRSGNDVVLNTARTYEGASAGTVDAQRGHISPQVGTNCTNYHWEDLDYSWAYTRMGSLNSAGDTAQVQHIYGTSSDIWVDTAFTLSDGSWGLSAATHSGEGIGSEFGVSALSNFHWGIYVPMDYVESYFYADCYEGHVYQNHAEVRQIGYHDGRNLTYSIVVSQPARDKSHSEWALQSGPGTTYSRIISSFKKYSAAVVMFGASLGSSSVASSYSKQSWRFGTGQTWHYLYGAGISYKTAPIIYASNS